MEITSDKEIIVIVIKGLIIDFANGPKNDFIPNIPYHPEQVKLITGRVIIEFRVIIEESS